MNKLQLNKQGKVRIKVRHCLHIKDDALMIYCLELVSRDLLDHNCNSYLVCFSFETRVHCPFSPTKFNFKDDMIPLLRI